MFKELGAMMNLLGNKGKIAEEVAKFQQAVAQLTAEGTAGGGMVTVKVSGKLEVLSCTIGEDAMKLNDREMLEDLVVAATNQALSKVREQLAVESAKVAASLGLPPGALGGIPGLS
jgi:DNA-binding YbaB/EbfC family protein